ncbi:hypothetical protein AB6A40_002104 [Gnathostoma spinigerum]|uniref:RecQ-mediated genome instability protein 1 n=1 Tax=Gnathostoma spinigerum TaxID=75299 RepID=A0ABD6E5R4_9BILA
MDNTALINKLIAMGWPVEEQMLKKQFDDESVFRDSGSLQKALLDTDIHEYASPVLIGRLDRQKGQLKGPVVLQMVKRINISYPKLCEGEQKDGIFKLHLTDGNSSVQCVQFQKISGLNTDTPPGTKVLLTGLIPLENGLIVLDSGNCRVLGGCVEILLERWNSEKAWLFKPFRANESGAPKWIPFSKRHTMNNDAHSLNAANKNFRANDILHNSKKSSTNAIENEAFDAARKAQIDEIKQNAPTKVFAASQIPLKPKECTVVVSNAPLRSDIPKALKFSDSNPATAKGKRGKRKDDEDFAESFQRPSSSFTISDFFQSPTEHPVFQHDTTVSNQSFQNFKSGRTEVKNQVRNVRAVQSPRGSTGRRRGRLPPGSSNSSRDQHREVTQCFQSRPPELQFSAEDFPPTNVSANSSMNITDS